MQNTARRTVGREIVEFYANVLYEPYSYRFTLTVAGVLNREA